MAPGMFKQRKKCPHCGAYLQSGATLCPHCGQELVTQKESEHCPACGARMLVSEGTCPICGASHHVPRPAPLINVWAVLVGILALLILVGAMWLVKPWAELVAVLGPTNTVLPTPTHRPTVIPSLTLNPTPTRKLTPTITASPSPAATPPRAEAAAISSTSTMTDALALTPTALGAVTPTAAATAVLAIGGPTIHVVEAGDTLGSIAVQYDVTSEAIAQANDIRLSTILDIGQELIIPVVTAATTATAMPSSSSEEGTAHPGASPSPAPQATSPTVPAATPTKIPPVIHVVEAGDLLGSIATQYDTTSAEIAAANGIEVSSLLNIGQELVIPVTPTAGAIAASSTPSPNLEVTARPAASPTATPTQTPVEPPAKTQSVVYVVKAGDLLGAIAAKYDLSTEEIAAANGIGVNSLLHIGQELTIPVAAPSVEAQPTPTAMPTSDSATSAPTVVLTQTLPLDATPTATLTPTQVQTITHVVESGDTMLAIAVKYQVSSEDIAKANGIDIDAMLNVGQELVIPALTPSPTLVATATPTLQGTPTRTTTALITPTITATPSVVYAYLQPHLLAPVSGSVFKDAEAHLLLNWSSVGILGEDEWYLLSLWHSEEDVEPIKKVWTKTTSYRLPAELYPKGQSSCHFFWQVVVVSQKLGEEAMVALSPESEMYEFCWK